MQVGRGNAKIECILGRYESFPINTAFSRRHACRPACQLDGVLERLKRRQRRTLSEHGQLLIVGNPIPDAYHSLSYADPPALAANTSRLLQYGALAGLRTCRSRVFI